MSQIIQYSSVSSNKRCSIKLIAYVYKLTIYNLKLSTTHNIHIYKTSLIITCRMCTLDELRPYVIKLNNSSISNSSLKYKLNKRDWCLNGDIAYLQRLPHGELLQAFSTSHWQTASILNKTQAIFTSAIIPCISVFHHSVIAFGLWNKLVHLNCRPTLIALPSIKSSLAFRNCIPVHLG